LNSRYVPGKLADTRDVRRLVAGADTDPDSESTRRASTPSVSTEDGPDRMGQFDDALGHETAVVRQ
jgi:hypothetical protein